MATKPAQPATKGGTVVGGRYYWGRATPPSEKRAGPPPFLNKTPDKDAAPLSDADMAQLKDQVVLLGRRVDVLEVEGGAESCHGTATDFLPSMEGSPGIVVDDGVARATPCTRFDLGNGKELMFSKGIVGGLDEGQKALYCPETITKPLSDEQQRRLLGWRESADVCKGEIADFPKGEKLQPWLACMSRELSIRGIELK